METNKLVIMFICIFFNLIGLTTQAQISEGGIPISFSLEINNQEIPTLIMPSFNLDSVVQSELELDKEGVGRPFRFGYAHSVDIDLKKSAMLKQLPNGDKLYLLKIHSENAFSINLIYSRYNLSKDSKFFVYNENRSMVLGAFTPEVSNNQYNEFATDLVQGNTIILEYYEPKYFNDGIIKIGKVIHGYINTFSNGLGTSENCNVDVNCPLGNNWENEKRAVSMILLNENSYWCTGCLINNTKQDYTPYYLTANHCLSSSTNTWIFRFKYWRPNCNSGNPVNYVSITGATIKANNVTTDFALLELNSPPPTSYNLHYVGWDRTTTPAQNATIPSGVTLELIATENIIINSGVIVKSGGTLILDGHTSINAGYTVESGASFIVKNKN